MQAVAEALEIDPFMLSRWRKEARDGVLRGRVALPKAVKVYRPSARCKRRVQALQRKYAVLEEEHALLKKTHPVHLRTKADVFAFIEEARGRFGVTRLCRLFAVTRAGFYAWRRRPVSARRRQDWALLAEHACALREDERRDIRQSRIQHGLRAGGHRRGVRRRVARLMR